MATIIISTDIQSKAFQFLNELRRHPLRSSKGDIKVPDVDPNGCYDRQVMRAFLEELGYLDFRSIFRLTYYKISCGVIMQNGRFEMLD